MDTQQSTALARALAEVPGPLPTSGVIHITIPHTERFTVVGNHLAQHPDLSCTAIGVAVLIQSLPQGAEISIKALAARCKEGEKRIAAALRELEAHGYLQRLRHRLSGKKVITRTVFCNQPAALVRPRRPVATAPAPVQVPAPVAAPIQVPAPVPVPIQVPAPAPVPIQAPAPVPTAAPPAPQAPPLVPPPTAPKPPRPPLPQPSLLTPELDRAATALLSDLRRHAPQFTLSEDHIRQLVPAVATWLERDADPDTIRRALTDDPPQPLRHPVKLLKHRLTALLPPPLPGAHDLVAPARPRVAVTPFQTCDDCDRAFRSPTPGHCRDCRETRAQHEHRSEGVPVAA
ncbi:hypothetical protein [Streptomyces sp. PTY087I2]|uniref:hypothetical protein n=1 Tax=Streptomyces sp. PTY087I2 TaxID=1819298 RepID=UPI00080BF7B9|nr:hypothetical protein [Streptomyces sp. PTY087I2]OCC11384.1 hypothetical protein A3Q37_02580 [Streptomyces sp. PTY087I2]